MYSTRKAAAAGTAAAAGIDRWFAYIAAAAARTVQPAKQAAKKPRAPTCLVIAGILAAASAAEPPPNLARLVAHRESETEVERNHYLYRETVKVLELSDRGTQTGEYREAREVIFSPTGARDEKAIAEPVRRLKNLILTDEDFRDIRDIQPFVLVEDFLPIYETKYRGEETVEGVDCWVLQVKPRQILQGQRLFDGLLWVDKRDYSVIRSEGQAVPQIRTTKSENLFPKFTTTRKQVNGFWFPIFTYADDTLFFRTGPQRIRLSIRFENYRKFGADTSITFGDHAK